MAFSMVNLKSDRSLRGSVVVADHNWVRILDCNGNVSCETTMSSATGYPVRGYWEGDYVVVEMSSGSRKKLTYSGGCVGVGEY